MAKRPYNPYYRNFPSTALPARTPFTRSGRGDAGYVFFYLTHRKPNWSLLLDKSRLEYIYAEAQERIPKDFTQFLLLEKVYSTPKPRPDLPWPAPSSQPDAQVAPNDSPPLVVLREPDPVFTKQGDLLSYYLHEGEAIAAANTYARLNQRRALVALLVWDERWY